MRLLIADQEIIAGGVETLRVEFVPKLAQLCESVVWAVPAHACDRFAKQMRDVPNLIVRSLLPSRANPWRILAALLRRVASQLSRGVDERLVQARLQSLARHYDCTHCLTTCVFSQPFPSVGLPVAGFVCDVNPTLPSSTLGNILDWVGRAGAIFAISDFTRAELCRLAPAQATRIHSIPLASSSTPRVAGEDRAPFDFYFPAAPNPHKGHATLFAACALLVQRGRNFRLVLSGPGLERLPALTEARRMLDGHLEVRGDVPPMEVDALFAAARCIVLPTNYEGFGLPLAEALRRGKEVICTDIVPFREQLERHSSFDRARLVPPADPACLAEAMEQHLDAPRPPLPKDELDRRLASWTWMHAAQRCHALLSALPR